MAGQQQAHAWPPPASELGASDAAHRAVGETGLVALGGPRDRDHRMRPRAQSAPARISASPPSTIDRKHQTPRASAVAPRSKGRPASRPASRQPMNRPMTRPMRVAARLGVAPDVERAGRACRRERETAARQPQRDVDRTTQAPSERGSDLAPIGPEVMPTVERRQRPAVSTPDDRQAPAQRDEERRPQARRARRARRADQPVGQRSIQAGPRTAAKPPTAAAPTIRQARQVVATDVFAAPPALHADFGHLAARDGPQIRQRRRAPEGQFTGLSGDGVAFQQLAAPGARGGGCRSRRSARRRG